MRVRIPTPLRSYTSGEANVVAEGATVRELLADLDRRFPGIAFRMVDEQGRVRQHMVVFLGQHRCRDLDTALPPTGEPGAVDEVVIMQALSGG
jgi:sulfur-carrier protein